MNILGAILLIIAFFAVFAVCIAFSGWIIMLVANIVLSYFGLKTLTFFVACAISLLISMVAGYFTKQNKK